MKKHYNITRLTEELNNSVFFQQPEQPAEPKETNQQLYKKPELSPTPKTQEEKTPEIAANARTDARVHTRTHARRDASLESDLIESLHRKLQQKHHLSSYTFRFRLEELEELTKLDTKVAKTHPNKLSKNDLVRLGVNWLLLTSL
jgi:hypothetical protein